MEKRFSLRVNITYEGYDEVLDRRIRSIAESYKGKELGSGYGFKDGSRDIDFEFTNLKSAESFCLELEKTQIKFEPSAYIEDTKVNNRSNIKE